MQSQRSVNNAHMSLFDIIAVMLTLAGIFGYINSRHLKLVPSVGLLLISLISSLGVMLLHWLSPSSNWWRPFAASSPTSTSTAR